MFERRLKVFLGILSAVVVLLLGRAAQLQVAQADEWRKEANNTLKKTVPIETSRGSILDRTGRELARDRACADACVIYYALTPKADPTWLGKVASARLRARMGDAYSNAPKVERQKFLEQEKESIQANIDGMWERLARISGKPLEEIERVKQSVFQRVEMRKKYIWYQSYLHATKGSGGAGDVEPRWQRWLSGQTDDAPEIDKFAVTVGEEMQLHVILHDISLDVQNELGRHPEQFPGLVLRPGQTRYYPYNDLACHILGRIGKVDGDDLARDPFRKDDRRHYLPNDEIGRTGLEALGEPSLRGTQGEVMTMYGGESVTEPAEPGHDLRATIDIDLQREIQKFFAKATLRVKTTDADGNPTVVEVPNQILHGAAVLLDVKTNQVLALVSYPTYDLNTQDQQLQAMSIDEINAPLRNRATETQFEPGSTVKPMVGLAGITEGVVKVNEGIECKGFLELPERRSGKMIRYGHTGRCWVASTYAEILKGNVAHHQVPYAAPHHGQFGNPDGFLIYADGLERSCNIYFETVADRLGVDALSNWMSRFGLGRNTGIGIHEFTGKVPNKNMDRLGVNRRTVGFLGGIGQMNVLATPLQMANIAATIARGGIWMRPHIVMPDPKTGQDPALKDGAITGPDVVDLHLDPEAVKACRLGMYNVVNSKGGTGTSARMDDLVVAGKTGTAQASPFRVVRKDPVTRKPMKDDKGNVIYDSFEPSTLEKPNPALPWYRGTTGTDKPVIDHSWMIGFAPANDPKVAYGVLVEYGGSGGGAAADVVRTALESCIRHGYLKREEVPPATQPGGELLH
jgi:penicillin-binding protein 2